MHLSVRQPHHNPSTTKANHHNAKASQTTTKGCRPWPTIGFDSLGHRGDQWQIALIVKPITNKHFRLTVVSFSWRVFPFIGRRRRWIVPPFPSLFHLSSSVDVLNQSFHSSWWSLHAFSMMNIIYHYTIFRLSEASQALWKNNLCSNMFWEKIWQNPTSPIPFFCYYKEYTPPLTSCIHVSFFHPISHPYL